MDKLETSVVDKLPRYIQVHSTLEFTRLVCALERAPRVSFSHNHDGKKILSVQMDVLKQKPIVYYTPLEHNGDYLCYGLKFGKEESDIVNSTSDSSKLYSPIIRIKSLPKTLQPGNGTLDRYQPIELEDLSSLAKLTWGFDDVPFPLFLFPHNDKDVESNTTMMPEEEPEAESSPEPEAEPEPVKESNKNKNKNKKPWSC